MANTVINLTDPISTLVGKTNIISGHVSDVATLTTTNKSNLVAAINEVNAAAITLASSGTMTNKTINLANNTVTGTTAQFNTALSDGSFATLAGSEALTNKTINGSNNTLSNINNLATNAVVTASITDLNVTTAKIANSAITSAKSANATIIGADIAADTVAEANMADDAIGSTQLKTLSTLLIKNSAGATIKTIHGAGA